MSWQDRLREHIRFISPSSNIEFAPLWKGNDISAEKRLGRHAYPSVDNETIQDLGMNSRNFPLTVYFDGIDHDRNARNFEKALFEIGIWQVIHPVYGLLYLQLISYKLTSDPTECGNITVLETEWVEPLDEITINNDTATDIETAIDEVNTSTAADMTAVVQDMVSQSKATAAAIKKGMAHIKNKINSMNSRINSIQNQINELTNKAYLDIASISGGVIELIESPGFMIGSVASKISMFANLGNRIINDLPNAIAFTKTQVNSVLVGQLFLNSITGAMGNTIITSEFETRREALSALSEYRQFTIEVQYALENVTALTSDYRMENQFVARANSGKPIATLNAAVFRYLIKDMFNLKLERRLILDKPRAPLEIAIGEYKATGETADYYYDFFCRTNQLHGYELLLLPAGKEILVYV